MIVISGGGNDFAGADDLLPPLQPGNPHDAASWFNREKTDNLFGVIKAGYERVIYLRDQHAPSIPILTHCYDYSKADGQGVLWFSPWIKPSLDQIATIDENFGAMLKAMRLAGSELDEGAPVDSKSEDIASSCRAGLRSTANGIATNRICPCAFFRFISNRASGAKPLAEMMMPTRIACRSMSSTKPPNCSRLNWLFRALILSAAVAAPHSWLAHQVTLTTLATA